MYINESIRFACQEINISCCVHLDVHLNVHRWEYQACRNRNQDINHCCCVHLSAQSILCTDVLCRCTYIVWIVFGVGISTANARSPSQCYSVFKTWLSCVCNLCKFNLWSRALIEYECVIVHCGLSVLDARSVLHRTMKLNNGFSYGYLDKCI